MGEVFKKLGLRTDYITSGLSDEERKQAYSADITYGTNNEFGFDYLRDNMKFSKDQIVQVTLTMQLLTKLILFLLTKQEPFDNFRGGKIIRTI